MWLFLVAGAAVVDAFATGVFIGKKWGASIPATIAQAGADVAIVEVKAAPVITAVTAEAKAAEHAIVTEVTTLEKRIDPPKVVSADQMAAAVSAQKAAAPK